MATYRKVALTTWTDSKIRGLSLERKAIWLFLLTHPEITGVGAIRATAMHIAADLLTADPGGIDDKVSKITDALEEFVRLGLIAVDQDAGLIVVWNFLRFNMPENPNVAKSWGHQVDRLPECPLRDELFRRVARTVQQLAPGAVSGLPPIIAAYLDERVPETVPQTVTETVSETTSTNTNTSKSTNKESTTSAAPPRSQNPDPAPDGFDDWWNGYPKKVARGTAKKAWPAAVKKVATTRFQGSKAHAIAFLVETAKAFAASPKGGGRFVPNPATWLNSERWDDDPESWKDHGGPETRMDREDREGEAFVRGAGRTERVLVTGNRWAESRTEKVFRELSEWAETKPEETPGDHPLDFLDGGIFGKPLNQAERQRIVNGPASDVPDASDKVPT